MYAFLCTQGKCENAFSSPRTQIYTQTHTHTLFKKWKIMQQLSGVDQGYILAFFQPLPNKHLQINKLKSIILQPDMTISVCTLLFYCSFLYYSYQLNRTQKKIVSQQAIIELQITGTYNISIVQCSQVCCCYCNLKTAMVKPGTQLIK